MYREAKTPHCWECRRNGYLTGLAPSDSGWSSIVSTWSLLSEPIYGSTVLRCLPLSRSLRRTSNVYEAAGVILISVSMGMLLVGNYTKS